MWDRMQGLGDDHRADLDDGRAGRPEEIGPGHVDEVGAAADHALAGGSGVKSVIVGATLKIPVLAPVPTELVRLTRPVSASSGITTCADVGVNGVGATGTAAGERSSVTVPRLVPVIVMSVPTGAVLGANPVARGGCWTFRFPGLVAVPSTVVTVTFAVTAPSGTENVSAVAVPATCPGGTVVAPAFTVGVPVSARRFVPVTVTLVSLPPTAVSGARRSIFGATRKFAVLVVVPVGFVRVTGRVIAPAGTTAFREVAVPPASGATNSAPLKVTSVTPVRLVPVMVTVAPTGADWARRPWPVAACPPSDRADSGWYRRRS